MKKITAYCFLLFLFLSLTTKADVRLPAIFGDHMVLQQQTSAKIWGWGNAMEEITLSSSWDEATYTTKTDSYGNWSINLQTPAAGGPYEITIKGNNNLKITDILIGEVWLGSGQSNMEWSANHGFDNAEQEVAGARHREIRFFQVGKRSANAPQLDLEGRWEVCSPESMKRFSAVGYFFARSLQEKLKIPVGIINSSWGGTPAETWINPGIIQKDPALEAAAEKIKPMPWCPEGPGQTYHSMIAPLIPFPLAGVIWYQGETNTANHETYSKMFTALIENWRDEWKRELPFYYVQIAPYKYDTPEAGVLVRDAQRQTLKVPRTGMVVVSDIGNIDDIHPRNKLDVGKRLANLALAKTYGMENIPFSGPLYKGMEVEGKKIRVVFDYADNGLVARGGALTHFEIAGSDGVFVEANARIDKNTVLVSSPKVNTPQAVRFAWSNTAEPNLFNKEGLPASAFRSTD